jgi:holin-like protein
MLSYLTLIFCCQLAGELVTRGLDLPVPGPVLGMVLLFTFLVVKGGIPEKLAATGDFLLTNLSLLFVPAGVGVMLHFRLLGDDWLPIAVALVVSTALTVAVTALLMARLSRAKGPAND